jgi:hypothetical protein
VSCTCDLFDGVTRLPYYVGDSAPLRVAFTDPDTGAPYNLDGCSLTFVVSENPAAPDSSAVIRLSTGSGIAILDAAGGLAAIFPPAATTALLVAGRTYTLGLILRDVAGFYITTATGYLEALAPVTLLPA